MTPTQRAAMEQALQEIESLENLTDQQERVFGRLCDKMRAALAEQPAEQESMAWVGLSEDDKLEILRTNGEAAVMYLTEAKLREKNAEQQSAKHGEPVAWMYFDSDGDAIFGHPNGYRPGDAVPVYTASQPAKHPFLVRDLAELIGSTVPDVCNALQDMGIEPRRSTNAAVTPDEALAVARRLAQPAKRVPLTVEDIDILWAKQQTKPFKTHAEDRMAFASAVIAAYDAKNGITGETK